MSLDGVGVGGGVVGVGVGVIHGIHVLGHSWDYIKKELPHPPLLRFTPLLPLNTNSPSPPHYTPHYIPSAAYLKSTSTRHSSSSTTTSNRPYIYPSSRAALHSTSSSWVPSYHASRASSRPLEPV